MHALAPLLCPSLDPAVPVCSLRVAAAKELHFNKDGAALKAMQQGVDKLASVVGVTLGPKGRNVVLESKFGSPKIVNDGVTVAKEVELEDPVENIGAKLVRQAAQKTNDAAGDGTTTATVLSAALIAEGMKVVAAGANPVQVTRGMDKTVKALVGKLREISQVSAAVWLLCDASALLVTAHECVVHYTCLTSQPVPREDNAAKRRGSQCCGGPVCAWCLSKQQPIYSRCTAREAGPEMALACRTWRRTRSWQTWRRCRRATTRPSAT